jgi:hypothetical protein
MKHLINEDIQTMKYLFGYKPGKVLSEQAVAPPTPATGTQTAAATTPEEVIKKIQTILKTKYKQNLGTAGPNKDGVDGKWGNLTQTAFEAATKNIKTPPAAGATSSPVSSGTTTTAGATTSSVSSGTTTTAGATTGEVPKHGEKLVGKDGKTTIYDGPNKKFVLDTEWMALYNPDGSQKITGASKADDIIDDGQPQLNSGSQQALSGQLTPQQIRQQARFDQRLARQARRNTRRAGQQGQQ